MEPIYPNITVKLIGQNGNAFNLLGIMSKAMRKNGVPKEEIDKFTKEATAGDYDHLLGTCMKWVDVR
jgi:hypothetical protein